MSNQLAVRSNAVAQVKRIIRGDSTEDIYEIARATLREFSIDHLHNIESKIDRTDQRRERMTSEQARSEIMTTFLNFVDFPELFRDVASSVLLEKWGGVPGTWANWVREDELDNFHPTNIISAALLPEPQKVRENQEYRRFNNLFGEIASAQLATYGDITAVTRQTLLNGTKGAFDALVKTIAQAYERLIGTKAYSILTSNPIAFDEKELFHADHNNVLAKTSDFSADLSQALNLMYGQKNYFPTLPDGSKTQFAVIQPRFVITSPAQSIEAAKVVGEYNKALLDEQKLSVIVEPRLVDFEGWFLSAAKEQSSICLFKLRGSKAPSVMTKEISRTDGLEVKHQWDIDVAPVDFRGLVRVM